MKQSYSVKSGASITQQPPAHFGSSQMHSARSNTSLMSSASTGGLFSRQGILQRKPKAAVVDKNFSLMVRHHGIKSQNDCVYLVGQGIRERAGKDHTEVTEDDADPRISSRYLLRIEQRAEVPQVSIQGGVRPPYVPQDPEGQGGEPP